jgi:drug/metabolite transporter (DMT)-like permease
MTGTRWPARNGPVTESRRSQGRKETKPQASTPDRPSASTVGIVMAAAGALGVGVQAALGISGNLLARMVQRFPLVTFLILTAVIVFISPVLISTFLQEHLPPARVLSIVSVVGLVSGGTCRSVRNRCRVRFIESNLSREPLCVTIGDLDGPT